MDDTAVEVPTRVLVFAMARPDGSIAASEIYEVAAACDQTSEQVRSCLRRLIAEGLLERDGSGRTARFRTTDAAARRLVRPIRKHRLADERHCGDHRWDERWHLASFNVPEDRRSARDRLRDELLDVGGAVISNGLYVSAHPWSTRITEAATELGIADRLSLATTTDLSIGGVTEPRELARILWPIDDLASAYTDFVDANRFRLDRLRELQAHPTTIDETRYVAGALAMIVGFNRVFRRDPLLPKDLLPADWPGRTARSLLVESRRVARSLRGDQERPALFSAFDDLIREPA